MSRQQFAETVANAYVSQYGNSGVGEVLGNPSVDYDPQTGLFFWHSSIVPRRGCDVRIFELEHGSLGDCYEDQTDDEWRADLVTVLAGADNGNSNELWETATSKIAEWQSARRNTCSR